MTKDKPRAHCAERIPKGFENRVDWDHPILYPKITRKTPDQVLAARLLDFSKIIAKEDITDDLNTYSHLRDEPACIRIRKHLQLDDCCRLFPPVRGVKSSDARQIVFEYLSAGKPKNGECPEPQKNRISEQCKHNALVLK